jgi:hypothetical protein
MLRVARFSVVVGKAHSLRRQAVKIRRGLEHDALVVGTEVEPSDIVPYDHGYSACRRPGLILQIPL